MGVYTIGVAGESYRQREIKGCYEGELLILKREPNNKYDPCAVAVLRTNGKQIGYIPRNQAVWVSRIMDEGKEVQARINKIVGGTWNKPIRGVVIDINTTPKAGWIDYREEERQNLGYKEPYIPSMDQYAKPWYKTWWATLILLVLVALLAWIMDR